MGRGFKPLSKEPEPLYKVMSWEEIMRALKKRYPAWIYGKRLSAAKSQKADRLIFTPEAAKELMNHFYWGIQHPNNLFEQQAALAGYQFKDPATGRRTAVVEFVISAIAKNRTPVGARLSVDDTADVQCELNVINRNLQKLRSYGVFTTLGDAQIIGWAHSHPNELDVFLSSTDRETHRTNYGNGKDSLGVSLVVNPHRRLARAFGGPNAREMEQIWMFSAADYARFTGEKMAEPIYLDVPATGAAFDFGWEKHREEEVRCAEVYTEPYREEYREEPQEEAEREVRMTAQAGVEREARMIAWETGREERQPRQEAEETRVKKNAAVGNDTKEAASEEEKEDEKQVTRLERMSREERITTPTGGAWPHLSGVPDGSQRRGGIVCGDIAGGTRYYESAEDYYRRHQKTEERPSKWETLSGFWHGWFGM